MITLLYPQMLTNLLTKVLEQAENNLNAGCEGHSIGAIMHDGPSWEENTRGTWLFYTDHPSYVDLRYAEPWHGGNGKLVAKFRTEEVSKELISELVVRIIDHHYS